MVLPTLLGFSIAEGRLPRGGLLPGTAAHPLERQQCAEVFMRHGRAASLITRSSTLLSDRCCCSGVIVAAVAVISNGTLLQLPLGVLLRGTRPSFEKPGDVPGAAGIDRGCQAHTGEWEREDGDVLLPRFHVITLGHVVLTAGARARRHVVAISSCVGLLDLLLEVCVPVVLDIIVCSLGKVRSYGCPSNLEIKPQRKKVRET